MINSSFGAVIAAAGMSSRMGAFKPLLCLGGVTAIERVINGFIRAGIESCSIIVVSGHNADELYNKLSYSGVILIKNNEYQNTDMLHSVKLGLAYLKGRYRGIFFTPADVPLFTAETVKSLMLSNAPVSVPVFDGKAGHPVLLGESIIDSVLRFNGEDGLRGAIKSLSSETERISVRDKGVLYDMDTPDDYSKLLKLGEI